MPDTSPDRWIAIARTGTFTDSEGRPHTFSAADLDSIAAAYAPAHQQSPLVLGHPKDNEPAMGWVRALKREGQKLFASFAQVPVNVQEMLDTGRYKYVSMSLMPDRVTLRHVGLLGAARPAMDGLGEVCFCEDDNGITINFSAQDATREGGTPRSGSEAATALAASDSASRTGRAGKRHQEGGAMPNPEELQQKIIELQQQMDALRAENAALKAKQTEAEDEKDKAEQAAEATGAEFAAFRHKVESEKREARVGKLIASGRLAPAEKATTVEFCAALAKVATPVNFSAPEGPVQVSAEERYWRELEARPVDARFADFAAPAPAHVGQGKAEAYSSAYSPAYSSAAMAAKL